MKVTKLEEKLKEFGVELTPEQLEEVKEEAVLDWRYERLTPVHLKKNKFNQVAVLVMAYTKGLDEMLHMIYEAPELRHDMKMKFNGLRMKVASVIKQFEKTFKDDELIMTAYRIYSNDIVELIYQHLDLVQRDTKDKS